MRRPAVTAKVARLAGIVRALRRRRRRRAGPDSRRDRRVSPGCMTRIALDLAGALHGDARGPARPAPICARVIAQAERGRPRARSRIWAEIERQADRRGGSASSLSEPAITQTASADAGHGQAGAKVVQSHARAAWPRRSPASPPHVADTVELDVVADDLGGLAGMHDQDALDLADALHRDAEDQHTQPDMRHRHGPGRARQAAAPGRRMRPRSSGQTPPSRTASSFSEPAITQTPRPMPATARLGANVVQRQPEQHGRRHVPAHGRQQA